MHTRVRAHVNEADLSIISPIQIENRDAIALTECPGRSKDYTEAITRIIAWQPDLVVTLVEESEIAQGTARLRATLGKNGISWQHFPIRNYDIPAPDAPWNDLSQLIHSTIDGGGAVLIHCWGGLGRSGMVAAKLLVERGVHVTAAIETVRAARPGAIETEAQERWIEDKY
jgi:protein-tyrosine phosphatase